MNWDSIAVEVERLAGGASENDEEGLATLALAYIVGERLLLDGVRHYVNDGPASELVRDVLRRIRSRRAMKECVELWRTSESARSRVNAIELLRTIGDAYAIRWLDELLKDEDPMVQTWASRLIDELVMHNLVERDVAESWATRFESHDNEAVRETATMIRRGYEPNF